MRTFLLLILWLIVICHLAIERAQLSPIIVDGQTITFTGEVKLRSVIRLDDRRLALIIDEPGQTAKPAEDACTVGKPCPGCRKYCEWKEKGAQ